VQPRKHTRYRLKVPVIFTWQDEKEGPQKAVGLTRDISLTGAFVFTGSPPPLGANVRLKGFLPPVPHAVRALQLFGEGLVVRVDPARDNETKGGFEVDGKPFVVRRAEKYR
jgi:PilZ domain